MVNSAMTAAIMMQTAPNENSPQFMLWWKIRKRVKVANQLVAKKTIRMNIIVARMSSITHHHSFLFHYPSYVTATSA